LFLLQETEAPPVVNFPFFVAGSLGAIPRIAYSFDLSSGFALANVASAPVVGAFKILAVGDYKAYAINGSDIYETDDGVNFNLVLPASSLDADTFSVPAVHVNGVFVLSTTSGVYRSTDGVNWSNTGFLTGVVAATSSKFYTSENDSFAVGFFESSNGLTWTPIVPFSVQAPAFGAIAFVTYLTADAETIFTSVLNSGTTAVQPKAVIYGSDDGGLNWTVRRTVVQSGNAFYTPAAGGLEGCVYANSLDGKRLSSLYNAAFVAGTSPIGVLDPGRLATRRGTLFECSATGLFAYSTDGAVYNSVSSGLNFVNNVA
jgi:hypothetical protein